jgi:GGDEF domain-containing protein
LERDLLVQALIVVIVANTLVIGLALLGGRTGRRRARAAGRAAGPTPETVPARMTDPTMAVAATPTASSAMAGGAAMTGDAGTSAMAEGGMQAVAFAADGGGTPVEAAAGGTPVEAAAGGTPVEAAAGGTPVEAAAGGRTAAAAAPPTMAAPAPPMAAPAPPIAAAPPTMAPPSTGLDPFASSLGLPPFGRPSWEGLADLADLDGPAGWRRALLRERHRQARSGSRIAAVSLEARGYRALEERFGREAAASISEPLAATIRALSRRADVVAQVGPAAFRVLLLDGGPQAASRYVERVTGTVDPWLMTGGLALRLSAGSASVPDEGGLDEAVRLSERRMHEDARRS